MRTCLCVLCLSGLLASAPASERHRRFPFPVLGTTAACLGHHGSTLAFLVSGGACFDEELGCSAWGRFAPTSANLSTFMAFAVCIARTILGDTLHSIGLAVKLNAVFTEEWSCCKLRPPCSFLNCHHLSCVITSKFHICLHNKRLISSLSFEKPGISRSLPSSTSV